MVWYGYTDVLRLVKYMYFAMISLNLEFYEN